MANVPRVKYFTEERKALINPDNLKKYQKYLQSSIIKNKDVKDTTYKIYDNYFVQFLVYIAENWDNIDIYSEDFMDNAVDIMEGFIMFCQETLLNHKKVINTKLSAVSSFYIWSMKRGYIKYHPFDGKLDRMKKANEEKVINSYFLTDEQVQTIRRELSENDKFTIQDQILFEVSFDSSNRIGALEKLALSKLDIENNMFVGVNNGKLSYDFYLPQYNLLTEIQGIQHEKPIEIFGGEEQFKTQQEHDRRKREYAEKNGYKLLEIWYYDYDRIEEILNRELEVV